MNHISTILGSRRLGSVVRAAVLLGAMGGVLALVGWSLAGPTGLLWVAIAGLAYALLTPSVSPRLVMRMLRAREVSRASTLADLVAELARRADLPVIPRVFLLPRNDLNAMSIGSRNDPIVAVTAGLLEFLGPRELAGVLAHEISHIKHDDLRLISLAGAVTRMTRSMAGIGWLLLILMLPGFLVSGGIPWLAVLLIAIGPLLSDLLWLALSRSREFGADLGAVELTGDPLSLASALERLEHANSRVSLFERLLGRRFARPQVPEMLRTHPNTRERVQRLLEMGGGFRHAA